MLGIRPNTFQWQYNNYGAADTAPGANTVPGASNAEGTWVQVASAANMAYDAWGIHLHFYAGATSAQNKAQVADIGIDPAGGTAYVEHIPNILMGSSARPTVGLNGRFFYFPVRIPAGSSVAVRVKGINATAGTVFTMVRLYGNPSRPEIVRRGSYAVTTGTITNTLGVSFTPGASSAYGSWVSLGTLPKSAWWHQLTMQLSNATYVQGVLYLDLAYGDASTKKEIVGGYLHGVSLSNTQLYSTLQLWPEIDLPAGMQLWVRGAFSGTPPTGFSAACVSIGGQG